MSKVCFTRKPRSLKEIWWKALKINHNFSQFLLFVGKTIQIQHTHTYIWYILIFHWIWIENNLPKNLFAQHTRFFATPKSNRNISMLLIWNTIPFRRTPAPILSLKRSICFYFRPRRNATFHQAGIERKFHLGRNDSDKNHPVTYFPCTKHAI